MDLETRKIKKGRGRDLLAKRADGRPVRPSAVPSAKNGTPRKTFVTTKSPHCNKLLTDPLDYRSILGKKYRSDFDDFKSHLGGELSVTQFKLIDQCTRLGLLTDLAWAEVLGAGPLVQDGKPCAAADLFLKSSRDYRAALSLLGWKCRARDVTLADVLEAKGNGHAPR